MPPRYGAKRKIMRQPKESPSIFERITGKTNPALADKIYNPDTYARRKANNEYTKPKTFKRRLRTK